MKLVECVPNFSEGRRPEVVQKIRDAIAAVKDVHILDVSSDQSHNRTVLTFVVSTDSAVDAAFAGIKAAREHIDLTKHRGEHPRMGAADVVPFIPLEGSTMEDCIVLARKLGERVGKELEIPVYLYERRRGSRGRGEFEGLRDEIGKNPNRAPDFGPSHIHKTAGAVAIGARPFLVAYNVYLGPATNVAVAKEVAKAVRGSSGGLRYVKGLGLEVDGQAQVSMNLVDTEKTPLYRAFDMVKMEAAAHGVAPTWSEIVGLVPERALFETAARHIQLRDFKPEIVLERKVRDSVSGGETVGSFVAAVAAPTPAPGGGSVAAHAGALAAALAQMVAGLTIGKKKYAAVETEMKKASLDAAALVNELSALGPRDAAAYGMVMSAYKMPSDNDVDAQKKKKAVDEALLGAADVPLETARACVKVIELAATVAEKGNTNAVSDAAVAALLAHAACQGAVYNVRINVNALDQKNKGARLVEECGRLLSQAEKRAGDVRTLVEKAMG